MTREADPPARAAESPVSAPEPPSTALGRATYAFVRLASWLVCLLSERAIAALGDLMGRLWFHVLRYRRRVILDNLRRAFPDLAPRALERLGREAAQHLSCALLELLRTPRYFAEGVERVVETRGLHHIREGLSAGRGLLIVTGHLGSFELCAGAMARAAAPLRGHLLVKSQSAGLDAFLTARRVDAGYSIIRDRRTLPDILRALRRNETVVFVIDQNATRNQGVFVDFFGETACTMAAVALVARRTGAPVLGASIWREGPGRHVIEVQPAFAPAAEGETDEALMQRYTRFIEGSIRAHPAQWTWTHRRWRTRPLG